MGFLTSGLMQMSFQCNIKSFHGGLCLLNTNKQYLCENAEFVKEGKPCDKQFLTT